MKKLIMIGTLVLVSIALISMSGCAKPEVAKEEYKTYSKYGFSFEYPKDFLVLEQGLLESQANDSSGMVQVGIQNDEVQMFQTGWIKMIKSTWEVDGNLKRTLGESFSRMETAEGVVSLNRGWLVGTNKAGHQMIYQYYNMTFTEGGKAYGIVAVFYCDESQVIYQLITINDTISAKQDILEDFQNYLGHFVCH